MEFRKGDIVDVQLIVREVGNSCLCVHHDPRSTAIWADKKNCTLVKRRIIGTGDKIIHKPSGVTGKVLFSSNEYRWVILDNNHMPETVEAHELELYDD